MIKKTDLLAAAARVIQQRGLGNLTLEAVASEAGVSKGGLLYHFSSKEELVRGLNEQSLHVFQKRLDEEYAKTGSYVQAYASASFTQIDDPEDYCADSSLLAAIANYREVLAMWEDDYRLLREKMAEEHIPLEKGLIVRLVCDGLLFSRMFDLDPLSREEQSRVLAQLQAMLREDAPC
ncbi:TetR/AcrR family transcriptional regulator [Brevibacillus sp. TJ4]|uniref:TetR/AcrR family transcriptional regulator n=1 Tax=Brevibacillus sp. TJ4 TaxID=3234853 RepID=UPI0037D45020